MKILYISFSNITIHYQNLFSILSCLYYIKNSKEIEEIIVFTDNKSFFEKWLFNFTIVKYYDLSPNKIIEWKGKYKYVFRIKIKAIEYVLLNNYTKILYLDGDTFFKDNPTKLFEKISKGNTIMYKKESNFGDENNKNWDCIRTHINANRFNIDNHTFNISLSHYMWNAGVIGIDFNDSSLIKKVLDLTDQYCSQVNLNKYHQDQVMFSYVFQTYSLIEPAEGIIFHYCYGYHKENFNLILKRFFNKEFKNLNYQKLLERVHEISLQEIPNKPVSNIYKEMISFLNKRIIGLNMAFDRVWKTKKIISFFERGKTYDL